MNNELNNEIPSKFNQKFKKIYDNFLTKPILIKTLDTYAKINEICPDMRKSKSSRNIKDFISETKVNLINDGNTRIKKNKSLNQRNFELSSPKT